MRCSLFRTLGLATAVCGAAAPAALVDAQYDGIIDPPAEYANGFNAIDTDLAREWLTFLAGPECAGRGTGQDGFMLAAYWVARQFEMMGLAPAGENGTYFQNVPFTRTSVNLATSSISGPNGFLRNFGSDFGSSSIRVWKFNGEVVFINAKGDSAELPENLDLEGKAVVIVENDVSGSFRTAMNRSGAAVRIYVRDEIVAPSPSVRRGHGATLRSSRRRSSLSITRSAAKDLAIAMGVAPSITASGSTGSRAVVYAAGNGTLDVSVDVMAEDIYVPNVLAKLEGSDPKLRHQYIGVGAHLDHNGILNGVIQPGADDDGSGTTAMLLVAKALTTNELKPKRSVVFMAFTGEEKGLVGSGYYAANPLMPLEDMSCLLQMDMVGRNEEKSDDAPEDNVNTIHLIGSKRISTQLHNMTIAANDYIQFEFEYDEEDVYRRSDHYKFAEKGVPITFLFSGFHPDYHKATDTIDKINFDKIVSAARLNYIVVQRIGQLPGLITREVIDD
ncbi:MAG: M20/M25/M40 family metallo-hydrolase [Armatimonadetes bacterium]|nr:M20/M25/M40 family metallo-hydrolase [Armatimonadota bacterium]